MEQSFRTRSYFDREAEAYLQAREGQQSFVAQRELVLDLLPPGSLRVLDLGCGPAVMAEALLERAYQVYGVDLSPRMVAYARTRMQNHWAALRCHFSTGNVERLAFADDYFDATLSMGVLEYLLCYDRALAEIRRVLRPGGTAVLTVPNRVCQYHVAAGAAGALREMAKKALGRPPAASRTFVTNRCVPWRLARQVARAGFTAVEGRFCNFILYPLHELHAGASRALGRRLERLAGTKLAVLLGTQYVVKARKP